MGCSGHAIFSVQQRSASDGAQSFLPPIGSTFNFATVPSQSHQPSYKALKTALGAASITAPHSNALAVWRDLQDPTSSAGTAQTHFPLDAAAAQRPFQPVEAPPRLEHRGGYPPRRGRFAIFTRYSWRSSKSHVVQNIEFYQGTYIIVLPLHPLKIS